MLAAVKTIDRQLPADLAEAGVNLTMCTSFGEAEQLAEKLRDEGQDVKPIALTFTEDTVPF